MYSQSTYQTQTITTTQGLTDVEGAKQVARRLFDTYDKGRKGNITNVDCVPMIVEAYKSFNQKFLPSHQDTQSYFRVLDRNGDGKVSYDDIESLCIRYLCPQYQTQTIQQQISVPPVKNVRRFSSEVEAKLDVARRLFNQFDSDKSGQLDQTEVLGLLRETYRQMGMNANITEDDVRMWMEMNDTDGDGKVSLREYEDVVIRSLRKAGFTIESQHIVLN